MNDHDRFLLLAAEGIDYPLTRDEQRRLARHLAGCLSCARRADALRTDQDRLRRLPSHRPPAVSAQFVAHWMEPRQSLLASPAASIALVLLLVLALAGTAVAGALLLDLLDRRPTGLVEPSPTARQVATPAASLAATATAPVTPAAATLTPTPPLPSSTLIAPSMSPADVAWADPVRVSDRLDGYRTERDLSVAVDDSGAVHVAASVYDGVAYLTNSGGSWSETRLSTAPEEGRDGEVSLALDDGSVWIAFTRWTSFEPCSIGCDVQPPGEIEGVFLVDNRTGDWADPQLVAAGMSDPSLAVRAGRFHLAYTSDSSPQGSGSVHYLTDATGSAVGELVAAGGSDGHLQLGADGRPRILFLGPDGLRLATATQPSGSFEVVDGPSGTQGVRDPSLALDAGDRAWAAWRASDDLAVHVASFDPDAEWASPEEVLRGASLGGFDIDAGGNVHVVSLPLFTDDSQPDLRGGVWYATNTTGDFVSEQLRSFPGVLDSGATFPAAIAVDRDGRPHIVFSWLDPIDDSDGLHYVVGPSR